MAPKMNIKKDARKKTSSVKIKLEIIEHERGVK